MPGCVGGEHRVALVIGNSACQSVKSRPNPAHEANAVGDLFAGAGLEVIAEPDLKQRGVREAFRNFSAKIAGTGADTVALVFYARAADRRRELFGPGRRTHFAAGTFSREVSIGPREEEASRQDLEPWP